MPDNQSFKFDHSDLGVVATEALDAEALSGFLNSSPDDVVLKEETPKTGVVVPETTPIKKETKKDDKKPEESAEEEIDGDALAEDFLNDGDEKKKEKEEDDTEDDKEEGDEEAEGDESVFSNLSKELVNLGVFTLDEGEELDINDAESFRERFELEKKKGASHIVEAFISRYGEDYQEMFDAIFVNGVKPQDYLNRYSRIESISSLDTADEDHQEKLVREMLRREKRSADYIEKRIEKMKNYGDMEEEAVAAKSFLLEREQEEAQNDLAKVTAAKQKQQMERQQYIGRVQEILNDKLKKKEWDGIPVSKEFAQEVGLFITKEKYQLGPTEYLTEFDKQILDLKRPENYETKVKLAMLFKLLQTDPTLSKIKNKAITTESNKAFQSIVNKNKKRAAVAPKTNNFFS